MRKKVLIGFLVFLVASLALFAEANTATTRPDNELGQVIIFPLYDVRDSSCLQYYSITNTSNDWIQGHLRFRVATNSVEVLDFDVILSPKDVFTFFVLPDIGNGKPGFYSIDGNTMQNSAAFLPSATVPVAIQFYDVRLVALGISSAEALEQMKMGYIEFIPEGAVTDAFMDDDSNGVTDYNNLLEAADEDISETDGIVDECSYPGAVLMGHGWFANFLTAGGYGLNAVAIDNFRSSQFIDSGANCSWGVNSYHIDDGYRVVTWTAGLVSGVNGLILHEAIGTNTAASNPFYRPDWATTYGPTLAFGDSGVLPVTPANMNDVWGSVDEVEANLGFSSLLGRYIDWVDATTYALLTFPTKYFHYLTGLLYDYSDAYDTQAGGDFTAGKNTNRTAAADYDTAAAEDLGEADPCIQLTMVAYDLEENTYTPAGTISPIRGGEILSVCDEVNYVTVGCGQDIDTHYYEGWFAIGGFTSAVDADNDTETDELPAVGYLINDYYGTEFHTDWVRP